MRASKHFPNGLKNRHLRDKLERSEDYVMTIHLPEDLESSVRALVKGGRFASVDDAMAEAARLLIKQAPPVKTPMTEQEFLRHLLDTGLMTQIPDKAADFDDPDDQPIDIRGEPLSETIIRERR
jgi:Arc/MetJ-type ribon-helix-helix transcriptional regulator